MRTKTGTDKEQTGDSRGGVVKGGKETRKRSEDA